jgi:flagellar basal body-associated protein FliL
MFHRIAVLAILALSAALDAAESVPPKPVPPEAKPADVKPAETPRPAAALDPTAAVVAEGRYTYHQRDLDALMQIAQRHARGKLGKADEEVLRQALLAGLTAREPLLEAIAMLPPAMTSHAREQLVLDLLAYQAEPAKLAAPPSEAGATAPAPADAAKPAAAPAAAPADGPVLIRLPPLTLNRTVEGAGKRQLVLGLALFFKDPALAKSLEAKAPLIQDAIIGYVQKLPSAQFVEPDQALLKSGLAKAVIAKVPEFPGDGILIPQLDATAGDGEAPKAP